METTLIKSLISQLGKQAFTALFLWKKKPEKGCGYAIMFGKQVTGE